MKVLFDVIGKCCNRSGMPARIANAILGELAAEPTLFIDSKREKRYINSKDYKYVVDI